MSADEVYDSKNKSLSRDPKCCLPVLPYPARQQKLPSTYIMAMSTVAVGIDFCRNAAAVLHNI
jgi:hypothetical protein